MKTVIYSVLLVIAILLQLTIAGWMGILNVTPDFTILAICFVALAFPRNMTTLFAFFTGLLRDAAGFSAPGVGALLFSLTGFVAGTLLYKRSFQKRYEVLLFFSMIIMLYFFLYHFLINATSGQFAVMLLTDLLPRFLYTVLILFLLLLVLPERSWNTLK